MIRFKIFLASLVILYLISSASSINRAFCSDMMPPGYDIMKPPSNSVNVTLEHNIFNIGQVNIQDQVIIL